MWEVTLKVLGHIWTMVVVPFVEQVLIFLRVQSRFSSPLGCFMSSIAFAYNLVRKLAQEDKTSTFEVMAYVLAVHSTLSVGVLLFGRALHRYSYLTTTGAKLEALGAWLFLNLDLFVLGRIWRVVKRVCSLSSQSILAFTRQVAACLRWAAQHLELVLDGVVRRIWISVRAVWNQVIRRILTCVFNLTWQLVLTIWRNPEWSMVGSLVVIAYAYQAHLGRAPAFDLSRMSSVVDNIKEVMSMLVMKSASLGSFLIKAGSLVFRGFSLAFRAGSLVATPAISSSISKSSMMLMALSDRPLLLFADSTFALISATVTLSYSRIALMMISKGNLTSREAVELAARVGRTSQRIMFVPILLALLLLGFSSRIALRSIQIASVPLALVYIVGSLLVFLGEVNSWIITSRNLLRHPERRTLATNDAIAEIWSLTEAPSEVFAGDCPICLESLQPEVEQSNDSEFRRVVISAKLMNGPREGLRRNPVDVSLEIDGERSDNCSLKQPLRSESTTAGEWTVHVNVGETYTMRIVNCRPTRALGILRTRTLRWSVLSEFRLRVVASQTADDIDGLVSVALSPGWNSRIHMWEFPGRQRKDTSLNSQLLLNVMRVDDSTNPACTQVAGVPELVVPELPEPPAPPEPPRPCVIRCGHAFHEHCIGKWLKSSHCCPLCREAVSGPGRAFQALF
jgi:hypothetical protein